MMLRGFESASESQKSSGSSFRRRPESRGVGRGECSAVEDFARRGACPPLGSGWVWQKPPCEFAVQNRNSSFSYLGVPAPAGMSDFYESMSRTTIRDALEPVSSAPLNPNTPRSRHSGAPQFVIPAKAGIHALTSRERTPTAIPPPASTRRPHCAFPAKAPPALWYGTGIQGRWSGDTNDTETLPATRPLFSYLGVLAPAGMSDCNEERPLQQPHIGHSRSPLRHAGRSRNPGRGHGWSESRKTCSINQMTQPQHLGFPAAAGPSN